MRQRAVEHRSPSLGSKRSFLRPRSQSVACTLELRRRFLGSDQDWMVEQGSVLDEAYLRSLGAFDIVYSWGVLHHTGAMWKALENALIPVAPGGQLFIAIYNDQGTHSRRWRAVKRFYNRTPPAVRGPVALGVAVHQWGRRTVKDFLLLRPFSTWRTYSVERNVPLARCRGLGWRLSI